MPINWKSPATYQRLLAAIYAASPQSHNYALIATMFGEGATYDSIEGRFRIIKREAAALRAEVESGARPAVAAEGKGRARKGNAKNAATGGGGNTKQTVLAGRVTKNAGRGKAGKKGGAVKVEPGTLLGRDALGRDAVPVGGAVGSSSASTDETSPGGGSGDVTTYYDDDDEDDGEGSLVDWASASNTASHGAALAAPAAVPSGPAGPARAYGYGGYTYGAAEEYDDES
ncbi:MAG: hypothetical protein M1832_001274 [Thelocarpon impressellum]|nr:MAG: hypothetical protein M1832_001274 [Thelocarpon impressellum]